MHWILEAFFIKGDIGMKTIVITGASKGIGKELARLFANENVVSLSRTDGKIEKCRHICCDVSDEKAVEEAFSKINELYGRIDILINNAGMGISGSVENTPLESAKKIIDINLTGLFLCTKYALPHLRESKGRIINISSVAAVMPIPFQAFYSATKAAVSSFSDALRGEVAPFGVSIMTVLPGDIKTEFTSARQKNIDDGVYTEKAAESVRKMENDEQNGMSAGYAARRIHKFINKKRMPYNIVVGRQYSLLISIAKFLPKKLVLKILYKMYS